MMLDLSKIWPEWTAVEELGEGSYGKVYKCVREERGIRSECAVKVITIPRSKADVDGLLLDGLSVEASRSYFSEIVDDFANEIRVMEDLKGAPGIVAIEDYKIVERTDRIGWDIYIRMELLTPFKEYAQTHEITQQDIVTMALQLCEAMEICSAQNILHRDIKPENIFVDRYNKFKLGDFGVAKQIEKTMGASTKKGTYSYMAPEVNRGEHYDIRADIYSLGMVMYRLLNNNRDPFVDPQQQMVSYRQRADAMQRRFAGEQLPEPLHADADLARIILKCCAFDPNERYGSFAALANDLNAIGTNNTAAVGELEQENGHQLSLQQSQERLEQEMKQENTDKTPKRGSRKILIAAVALVLVAAIVIGVVITVKRNAANPLNETAEASVPIFPLTVEAANRRNGLVATGTWHTVGLRKDGTVIATQIMGEYDYEVDAGQCDISGWTDVVAVSAGEWHTVGLRKDGTVIATGDNEDGKCDVSDWRDIVAVSAGVRHTVGLRKDGTVIVTGDNNYGQCNVYGWTDIVAVSAGGSYTVGLRKDGTVVATEGNGWGECAVSGWTDIIAVSAGIEHTVGLRKDGTVVATGKKDNGQCDVTGWTDIVAVSAGNEHTVGLRKDGTVVATGENYFGECDVTDWTDIVVIAAGYEHTVGLRQNGTVVATGDNNYGQCDVSGWKNLKLPDPDKALVQVFPLTAEAANRRNGLVTAEGYHTVGLRKDGTVAATGRNVDGQCDVSDWTDVVAVSAGDRHTVGLRKDGTVVATGEKDYGQCDVSGWTDIVAVSAGFDSTVGLREDGTVVATGENSSGECDVSGWADVVAVSAGVRHTVGLRKDGTVVATGDNERGSCDVSGWTDVVAVSAGQDYTVGLREDGTVVATGYNESGQCDVSGWTDIVAVSAGVWHTVGLRKDGTVVATGDNEFGECDVSSWTNTIAVSAGSWHTVGLRKDGAVVATGNNEFGECDVYGWKNMKLPE